MKALRICVFFLFSLLFFSCANFQAGLYLLFIDRYNGKEILNNEPNVKAYLERILASPENYRIEVYKRTGISSQLKRTKLLEHSFYVITDRNGVYHTISFYGTAISFISQGTWAMDADSDLNSYNMYLDNKNKWDVTKVITEEINVEATVKNIIRKLDMHVTFYYRDHLHKKPNMNNCNTALRETIVFKITPRIPDELPLIAGKTSKEE